MTMSEHLQVWSDFYFAVATVTGVLAGLLFVVLALNPSIVQDTASPGLRIWSSETFNSLVIVLTFSLLFLIPTNIGASVGLPIVGISLFGLRQLRADIRVLRLDPDPRWSSRYAGVKHFSYMIAALILSTLIGVTLSFNRGELIDLMSVTVFLLFINAADNCWDILKEIGKSPESSPATFSQQDRPAVQWTTPRIYRTPRRPKLTEHAVVTTIPVDVFRDQFLVVWNELFQPTSGPHYLLDDNNSFFETLADISAEEANIPVSRQSATLAAQVQHTAFYVEALRKGLESNWEYKADWDASWQIDPVDDAEWRALIGRLRAAHEWIVTFAHQHDDWNADYVGGAFGLAAHSAYHLGEVRQGIGVIRSRGAGA